MDALEDNGGKTDIKPGMTTTGGRRHNKIPKKITETYLRNSALSYLQRFAASTAQFRRVMERKIQRSCHHHTDQNREGCQVLLEALIADFQRSGLLNDDLYLRGSIASLRRRGLSHKMIVMKLQEKGFSSAQAQTALAETQPEEIDPETMELAAALRLARRKKIGPYATPRGDGADSDDDADRSRRALAAMARAGFSFDTCRKVMTLDIESAEEIRQSAQAFA